MDDVTESTGPTVPTGEAEPEGKAAPRRALVRRLWPPFLASFLVQSVLVLGDKVPSIDTLAYLESGRSLLGGHGYVRQGAPEMHFPPGVPIGLAVFTKLTGDELRAVQAWNLAWGLALVAVMVAVAWRISRNEDATVATAWIATAVGGGVCLAIRGGGGSEAPTAVLAIAAALLVIHLIDPMRGDGRRSVGRAIGLGVGAGALMGIAYLMRPEALLWSVALVIAAAWAAHRQRAEPTAPTGGQALAALAGFGLVFVLLAAPYVAYQHSHSGTWSITSKTKDASMGSWRAIAEGDRLERDRILYAIAPDGHSFRPPGNSLLSMAREHPGQWLAIIGINVRTLAEVYGPWQLIPLFILVPALERLWRTRRRPETIVLGAIAAVPVLTCIVFFTLPRYLILTTAVLVPYGIWGLVQWIAHRTPTVRRVAWGGVVAGCLLSLFVAAWPLLPGSSSAERTEQEEAGRWIDANVPADARVMTRSYQLQHYVHRPVVTMPYAPLDDVLTFARARGATYLVADETNLRGRRPELVEPLLESKAPPDGLVLVHELDERGRTVRIYRLDPPPPASKLPPIPLGYVSD